jgi:very-short-patch-repair endonuclease
VPPGSVFARRMADVLEDAGLPRPVFEHPVLGGRYHLDLAWPERMVAVECHGRDHEGPRALERDPERLNDIRLAGWFVLEYRWRRFIRRPAAVVAEVRQSLCG